MKTDIKKTIENLQGAIDEWLSPNNLRLKDAIDKSINEGLFSFEDIKFQILTLKKTLQKSAFKRWISISDADQVERQTQTTLCLHAGNLPLVGVQDILAVVLAGNRYIGKLSKKDPYLPATLLDVLKKHNVLNGTWSVDLDDLAKKKLTADNLMFSGSTESIDPVIEKLTQLDLADTTTPSLMRTAHYSIAFIEDDRPETYRQLAEAVLRYGGGGCRSVAMVVAPNGFKSKKCEFTDYVEEFWMQNPQHKKPHPSLYHRFAYNRAVNIEQSWLDHFLIEQTDHEPVEPFILHWVEGDKTKLEELVNRYRDGLQTVYVTHPDTKLPDSIPEPEMLSDAQQPFIRWRPDGVDPLKWLIDRQGA